MILYSSSFGYSMFRAVAFDLDNTLIDFMRFKRETAEEAAKAMVNAGLDADPQEVADSIFNVYDEYGIEYQKTFSKVLWKKYRVRERNRFEHVQQAAIAAYLKKKFKVLKPYPDVVPTLKRLGKKFSLWILTDAPRNKAWQRMVITGLDKIFEEDRVITLDDTGQKKPGKMPFKTLVNRSGLAPEEILFVGDNPVKDVKGAKAAGMRTAWAKYGHEECLARLEAADYTLERFSDLLKILL